MLEPKTRMLLFDVLRPPDDHVLDFAVATTFTLDLTALLVAPVAFTLFEADEPAKLLDGRSLALLESLRRYADRIVIFCQSGRIAVPRAQFPQFEYLERAVIECQPKIKRTFFHPKVWLLRFTGPDALVTYRFACLSRNLTFDRCWDTAITLEGPLLNRQNAIARNHPLGDFVAALPELARHGAVSPEVRDRIAQFQSEVRRVDFEPPEPFEEFSFHPLGLSTGRRDLPFGDGAGRMLVMSPFLTDDGLARVVKGRKGCLVISRSEALQELASPIPSEQIEKVFALNDQADLPGESTSDAPLGTGLHAKCYIVENGWKASVWSGSANATEQGFNGNLEFLVELIGSKSKVGIDALFERKGSEACFADLLVPFERTAAIDEGQEDDFRVAVEQIRNTLADGDITATVLATTDSGLFSMKLQPGLDVPPFAEGLTVRCWPITLGEGWKRTVVNGFPPVLFEGLSLEALTSFFAFEVFSQSATGEKSEAFVLNATLEGAPADRRERLLRSLIGTRQRFVQLLLSMLADEGFELSGVLQSADRMLAGEADPSGGSADAILESLLRALSRRPERLAHVASLIADLEHQEDAAAILPPGFDAIWKPIWSARED